MFVADGKVIPLDRPFNLGDLQYPANWLRLSTEAEKAAVGITWVPDPEPVDTRFYWDHGIPKQVEDVPAVDEDGDPILDAEGVQVINRGLKSQYIAEQKQIAGSLLASSDWYIIRKADTDIDVPVEVKQYRDEVRLTCGLREDQISQVTSTEELAALLTNSPTIYSEDTKESISNPAPHLIPWPKSL